MFSSKTAAWWAPGFTRLSKDAFHLFGKTRVLVLTGDRFCCSCPHVRLAALGPARPSRLGRCTSYRLDGKGVLVFVALAQFFQDGTVFAKPLQTAVRGEAGPVALVIYGRFRLSTAGASIITNIMVPYCEDSYSHIYQRYTSS